VYNSSQSIRELVRRIINTIETTKLKFEIILVDDYSRDNSLEIITVLSNNDQRVRVIALKNNSGQQSAIKEGITLAMGEMVITIDDDLEQQPEDIPLLIQKLNMGYDVVYGVPNRTGYPFYRQVGSNIVDIFFTLCLQKPRDKQVGSFRVMNRKIADAIIMDQTPFVYITAITLRHTKNIGNTMVNYEKRKYGQSNYTVSKLVSLFLNLYYHYRKA
jgi:undecaprenyl-phosphate 4-deoxy-4-formamido-L-arabinose transferase